MALVPTNNNLSTYFEPQWAARHWCPLSSLIFTVTIKPLAKALRQHTTIKEIHWAGPEHKNTLGQIQVYGTETLYNGQYCLTLLTITRQQIFKLCCAGWGEMSPVWHGQYWKDHLVGRLLWQRYCVLQDLLISQFHYLPLTQLLFIHLKFRTCIEGPLTLQGFCRYVSGKKSHV